MLLSHNAVKSGHCKRNAAIQALPSQYFAVLAELVEDSGCDSGLLLEDTGLTSAAIRIPDRWIDHRIFEVAVLKAYQLTANPALGLDFGQRLNISSHTALGYAAMNSETLERALGLLLRYYRLVAFNLKLDFANEHDYCFFTVSAAVEPPFHKSFSYECLFAAFNSSMAYLLQGQQLQARFDITGPEPSYSQRYYELLGPDVRFGQPRLRMGCHRTLLSTSLAGANPGLAKLYEAQCQDLLSKMDLDASVAEKVRALLDSCEGAYPGHDVTATMLAMSPRTLRRKLQQEETSFQLLLDQARARHAIDYLQQTRLPLSSIAYVLGFNDASNFRRAFQRWTGKSPLQFRRRGD